MKLLLLLIFISQSAFSQNIDSLKASDTIYILLKETDEVVSKEYKNFKIRSYSNTIEKTYEIYESNKTIVIHTDEKKESKKNNSYLKVKRKKFLEHNKDKIITLDFIEEHTPGKVFSEYLDNLHKQKKVIYIINEDDLKRRKLCLKKAQVFMVGYLEI